jgi:hypothetical protein
MERISIHAPAKVNLRLDILGKRPDGYHEIKTWIYPISLADELHIKKVNTATITISSTHPDLPMGEENLAHRAAALFLKEQALSGGAQIEIIKRIPLAAGLGGGSSDAAAVLKGMNILGWVNGDGVADRGGCTLFCFWKGCNHGGKRRTGGEDPSTFEAVDVINQSWVPPIHEAGIRTGEMGVDKG